MTLFQEIWSLFLGLNLILKSGCQTTLLTLFEDRCVTNATSAIAAIYNLSNSDWIDIYYPHNIRKYSISEIRIPEYPTRYPIKYYRNNWEFTNSLLETANHFILDRRWEYFPIYITKPGTSPITLLENSSKFSSIALSVQIDYEANIFLCENGEIPLQNCYWLILRKENITFKKCQKLEDKRFYIETACEKSDTVKGDVLIYEGWNHFIISLTEKEIILYSQHGHKIASDKVVDSDFYPRYFMAHTATTNGLWKVHSFNYYFSRNRNSELNITIKGRQLNGNKECLSFFTVICSSCLLKISVRNYRWYYYNEKFTFSIRTKDTRWKEQIFCFDWENNDNIYLFLTTDIRQYDGQPVFWAISDVRISHPNEMRVLRTNEYADKCQLIESGITIGRKMDTISVLENQCAQNQFGEDCQMCNIVFEAGTCPQRSEYCQLVRTISSEVIKKCYCTGETRGSACKEPTEPLGLNATWTPENYLNIEWYHPTKTNGLLTKFGILQNKKRFFYNISSQAEYQMKYKFQITEGLTFPNKYQIEIFAENSAGTSSSANLEISGPPPIPFISIQQRNHSFIVNITYDRLNPVLPSSNIEGYLYELTTRCKECAKNLTTFYDKVVDHHQRFHNNMVSEILTNWSVRTHNMSKTEYETNYKLNLGNDYKKFKILAVIVIYRNENYVRGAKDIFRKNNNTKYSFWLKVTLPVTLLILLAAILWIYKGRKYMKLTYIEMCSTHNRRTCANLNDHSENEEKIELKTICPGHPLYRGKHSKRIKLDQFENYVRNAIISGELADQHKECVPEPTPSSNYGRLPDNKHKNRYQNRIAYDHSRVILHKKANQEYSDYINANYINGYRQPMAYIATQGPKKNTIVDFWQMIWQENVKYIIVVANIIEGGKSKIEQYWPDVNQTIVFEDYTIVYLSSTVYANYEHRQFNLKYRNNIKLITQLQFTAWPDHGVPLYPQSLIPLLKAILKLDPSDFPMVVHCSAGIGRTGTIILCDICMRMAVSEGYLDVYAMLEHLRKARPNMVDNIVQYTLAHLVLINCLLGKQTSIPADQHFSNLVQDMCRHIESQLQYITDCEWQENVMRKNVIADNEVGIPFVPEKNRFENIVPEKAAQVYLYPNEQKGDSSTYINAVRVDGFHQPGRFIVTQFPLPTTVADFWRLVLERNISVVICLNEMPTNDNTFEAFFPTNQKTLSIDIGQICHRKTKPSSVYDIFTFEIFSLNEIYSNSGIIVQIVKFNGWSHKRQVPKITTFVPFIEDVTRIATKSNPALVTCYDGATGCGLFIAMFFLIEKVKWEQECDVCQAIRTIRTSRKQFVNSKEQMEFLYKASVFYVESRFSQYSNMTA